MATVKTRCSDWWHSCEMGGGDNLEWMVQHFGPHIPAGWVSCERLFEERMHRTLHPANQIIRLHFIPESGRIQTGYQKKMDIQPSMQQNRI